MVALVPKLAEKARPFVVYFATVGLIGTLCIHIICLVGANGAFVLASLETGASHPSRVDQFFLAQAKRNDPSGALAHQPVVAMEEPALPASVIAAQLDAVESSLVDACRSDESDCVNDASDLALPNQAETYDSIEDGLGLEAVRPRARPAPRLRPVSTGYRWAGNW